MIKRLRYETFIEDYIEEAAHHETLFYESTYKDNYYLRDNLLPYVNKVLLSKENQKKIIDFTGKFIDDNSTKFNTSGPVYKIPFTDKEISFLYQLFDITNKQLLDMCKDMFIQTYDFQTIPYMIQSTPHKVLITAMIVDSLQNNYTDMIECSLYLFAFVEYPLVYHIFWPYDVNKDVMEYTIEHLGNKFKIKNFNNLLGLLKYDMDSSLNSWKIKLTEGADNSYIEFISRVRTQIRSKFRNISREYYKNYEKNATQHASGGKTDDGNIIDQDGHSSNAALIVDNTYNKFITNGVNEKLASVTAEGNKVSSDNVISYLNMIQTAKNNKLYKLIDDIITSYLLKNPTNTSVSSAEFVNYGLTMYRSIGISKNETFKEIKDILNFWMFDIIDIKQYTSRDGTITNYTRAIFNYIILMINYYN
jgi:hypothetical protein